MRLIPYLADSAGFTLLAAAFFWCSFGRAGGIPRRLCPVLVGLREEVVDGKYTLVSTVPQMYRHAVMLRCTLFVPAPHWWAVHC
jgi:hypothetical protein